MPSVGQELLDVPLPDMVAKLALGIDDMVRSLAIISGLSGDGELPHISNARQAELLGRSTEVLLGLEDIIVASGHSLPEVLVLADLREASDYLQEVTGKRTSDDLLDAIFSAFCIGK